MTPWPDLRVLELLVAIEETGGLGAAARQVGMAQPNASRALATLEKDLGLRLVQRGATGSTLTAAGTETARLARASLDAARVYLDGVEALRGGEGASIAIAASMTIAEYLIPRWLGAFRRAHPQCTVSFAVHNSHDVFEGVRSGAFDIGFVESPEPAGRLNELVVSHDRMTVVVGPEHPWATREAPLTIPELARTPLVVREEGSGTRVTLDDFLAPFGPVPPAVELRSNAAVKISVQAGAGPAVLSYLAVEASLRNGELVAIPVTGLHLVRDLRAVWRGAVRLTGTKASLIETALASADDR